MRYPLQVVGFEGRSLEVDAGLFGRRLYADGTVVAKGKKLGQMLLRRNDGREVVAKWIASLRSGPFAQHRRSSGSNRTPPRLVPVARGGRAALPHVRRRRAGWALWRLGPRQCTGDSIVASDPASIRDGGRDDAGGGGGLRSGGRRHPHFGALAAGKDVDPRRRL